MTFVQWTVNVTLLELCVCTVAVLLSIYTHREFPWGFDKLEEVDGLCKLALSSCMLGEDLGDSNR